MMLVIIFMGDSTGGTSSQQCRRQGGCHGHRASANCGYPTSFHEFGSPEEAAGV
jgi:hypothetical protein